MMNKKKNLGGLADTRLEFVEEVAEQDPTLKGSNDKVWARQRGRVLVKSARERFTENALHPLLDFGFILLAVLSSTLGINFSSQTKLSVRQYKSIQKLYRRSVVRHPVSLGKVF